MLEKMAAIDEKDIDVNNIARSTGVSKAHVYAMMSKWSPAIEGLKVLQRDHFMAGWQWFYMDTLEAALRESQDGTLNPSKRRDYAVTMGICTEKSLLVAGQPTSIVAGLHQHRHQLGEIATKMGRVTAALLGAEVSHTPTTPTDTDTCAGVGTEAATSPVEDALYAPVPAGE